MQHESIGDAPVTRCTAVKTGVITKACPSRLKIEMVATINARPAGRCIAFVAMMWTKDLHWWSHSMYPLLFTEVAAQESCRKTALSENKGELSCFRYWAL